MKVIKCNSVQMSRKDDDLWWMGLHTFKSDGRFRWSDHSVLNYVSWGLGQPRPISKEPKCVQVSASKGSIVYEYIYTLWFDNLRLIICPLHSHVSKSLDTRHRFEIFNSLMCYKFKPGVRKVLVRWMSQPTNQNRVFQPNAVINKSILYYNNLLFSSEILTMFFLGEWSDQKCHVDLLFVCKRVNVTGTIPPTPSLPLKPSGCPPGWSPFLHKVKTLLLCFITQLYCFTWEKYYKRIRMAESLKFPIFI